MKPTVKMGTAIRRGTHIKNGRFFPNDKPYKTNMFQRDIDLIEKIGNTNLAEGDQEYLIGALLKLARLEEEDYNWTE